MSDEHKVRLWVIVTLSVVSVVMGFFVPVYSTLQVFLQFFIVAAALGSLVGDL